MKQYQRNIFIFLWLNQRYYKTTFCYGGVPYLNALPEIIKNAPILKVFCNEISSYFRYFTKLLNKEYNLLLKEM